MANSLKPKPLRYSPKLDADEAVFDWHPVRIQAKHVSTRVGTLHQVAAKRSRDGHLADSVVLGADENEMIIPNIFDTKIDGL